MKLAEYQVKALKEQMDRIVTERDQLRSDLAAVPWGAIGRILDRIETPEDRYTVALWHLENRGM